MMKKAILCLALVLASGLSFAQDGGPLVGVWQQVVGGNPTSLTIGPNGKVFMPDGRVFGYFLNPTDFEKYEQFDFAPWLLGSYVVTSDSTYTENVYINEHRDWEGVIDFRFQFLNSRTLLAMYDHTYPDGSVRTITDLWVKAVYDDEELKKIQRKVSEKWDTYMEQARKRYGR